MFFTNLVEKTLCFPVSLCLKYYNFGSLNVLDNNEELFLFLLILFSCCARFDAQDTSLTLAPQSPVRLLNLS